MQKNKSRDNFKKKSTLRKSKKNWKFSVHYLVLYV